jgi:hypothetical protein
MIRSLPSDAHKFAMSLGNLLFVPDLANNLNIVPVSESGFELSSLISNYSDTYVNSIKVVEDKLVSCTNGGYVLVNEAANPKNSVCYLRCWINRQEIVV